MRLRPCLTLAFGLLLLALQSTAVQVTLSKGDLDIELDTFRVSIFVATTNNVTGVRTRVPDFEFTMAFTHWGYENYPTSGQNLNYTLESYGPPQISNYSKNYSEMNSSIMEQRLILADNSTMAVMFEQFEKDGQKDYCGWAMPLNSNGVKVSVKFWDVFLGALSNPDQSANRFIAGYADIKMMFREGTSFFNGFPFPIEPSNSYLQNRTDPNAVNKVRIRSLLFREQRFTLTLDFVRNNTKCDSTETVCQCVPLDHLQFNIDTPEDFINFLGPTEQDPNPVKTFRLPFWIVLDSKPSGSKSVIDWDPNLSVLFDVPLAETPSATPAAPETSSAIGAGGIAGIVVGAIVLAAAATAIVVWRQRTHAHQMKGKLERVLKSGLDEDARRTQIAANAAQEQAASLRNTWAKSTKMDSKDLKNIPK